MVWSDKNETYGKTRTSWLHGVSGAPIWHLRPLDRHRCSFGAASHKVARAHVLSLHLMHVQATLLDHFENIPIPVAPPPDNVPVEPMLLPPR
mmetsp:Transcript_43589/g.114574  ORF Transcript_43589/g.114574 Transcript_43589/m.114574 type:complete len:92 (-) Transcript_43589:661-936(-)